MIILSRLTLAVSPIGGTNDPTDGPRSKNNPLLHRTRDHRVTFRFPHSLRSLSAHSMSCTSIMGFANDAFFPTRSDSRTPRALEHAPHTWIGMPNATVTRKASANGGHPTGTTAAATGSRIRD